MKNKESSSEETLQEQIRSLKNELESLRIQNRQLEINLQNANQFNRAGLWELDLKTKDVKWSDSMYDLFNIAREVKPDMKIFNEKLPPISQDKLNGAIRKTFLSGEDYSFEHFLIYDDKSTRNARTNLKLILNDQKIPVKLSGETIDITSLKSAQKELEKLSAIASKTSNGILILDSNGHIDWINQGFTIMTGYRMDEVKGNEFKIFLNNEKQYLGDKIFLRKELSQNHFISDEIRLKTKRKADLLALINISSILDYELNPESYIIILSDITRQRKVEEELRQSEKMAALGKLSAGLAHELNNPAAAASRASDQLTKEFKQFQDLFSAMKDLVNHNALFQAGLEWIQTITANNGKRERISPLELSDLEDELNGWLEQKEIEESWLIATHFASNGIRISDLEKLAGKIKAEDLKIIIILLYRTSSVNDLIDIIHKSTKSISDLVGVVKSYSFMDQAELQYVDIHQGIEDTIKILGHKLKEGVTISREFGSDIPPVEVHGSELNQVWTNLIDNAVDAMNKKGTIIIRTSQKKEFVQVEIEDNGPGIPDPIRSKIFDPFFTTKEVGKGTGLGLDIVQRIINNRCNGKIDVESNPGKTIFRVLLPINKT